MSNNFRVGQLVVCVNDSWGTRAFYGPEIKPIKSSIYTVRAVNPYSFSPFPVMLLDEIVNEPRAYEHGVYECAFHFSRFRPVQYSSTRIVEEIKSGLPKLKHRERVES